MLAITWAVLLTLCIGAIACVLVRTTGLALLVAALSAIWMPLNNGRLEGPVLITLDPSHGLTALDLFGYGGACLAAAVLVLRGDRSGRRRGGLLRRALAAGACLGVFGCGLAVAYLFWQQAPAPSVAGVLAHVHGRRPG